MMKLRLKEVGLLLCLFALCLRYVAQVDPELPEMLLPQNCWITAHAAMIGSTFETIVREG